MVTNLNIVLQGLKYQMPSIVDSALPHLSAKARERIWKQLLRTVMCRAHANLPPAERSSLPWYSPFVRRSVHDMYWGWEEDPLLVELNKLLKLIKEPLVPTVYVTLNLGDWPRSLPCL